MLDQITFLFETFWANVTLVAFMKDCSRQKHSLKLLLQKEF